jgi:hypothetical protein
MTDEGVHRYIALKKAVLANMRRIQNELARMDALTSEGRSFALRRIQVILDDPFASNGPTASP